MAAFACISTVLGVVFWSGQCIHMLHTPMCRQAITQAHQSNIRLQQQVRPVIGPREALLRSVERR